MTPQERPVPPEVTVDEGGRQILAPGFRRYLPCSAGCGFSIGCGDAVDEVAHESCLERAEAEPQERPVAGDGLDREAVRRRAEAALRMCDWLHTPEWALLYAADVPALLAALRTAEAEVERLRAENARIKWDAARRSPMRRLRTEGGAS